jgi:hypothetical protein
LRKLFSYRQISALFGRDGSEIFICGAGRWTGQLDISDNGARLIMGTGCMRAEGDAITFDGATLRSLTTSTGRVASRDGDLAISGDGSKVAAFRVQNEGSRPTATAPDRRHQSRFDWRRPPHHRGDFQPIHPDPGALRPRAA